MVIKPIRSKLNITQNIIKFTRRFNINKSNIKLIINDNKLYALLYYVSL